METLLLLHTERPTRRVFERRRPGRLLFASDEVGEEDRAVYDECVRLPPPDRVGETLGILERLPFDRLVAQTEYGLLSGALLAARRGLAAPSPAAAHLCVNKWLSRRALSDAGVPVPRFALVESASEVRRFAEAYPIVLKPVASTLARGVVRVDRPDDLDGAVERLRAFLPRAADVRRLVDFARVADLDPECDSTRQFLVEEFVEGSPLETDGLVFGERLEFFGVTEQVLSPPPRFFVEGYLFPADARRHRALTEAALRAVGLRDAGFSIEFRGETVIEVNGRLGEDDGFPDLFRAALGEFPILRWIEGRTAFEPARGAHALAYANRYEGGVVRSVSTPEGATAIVRAGQRLREPGEPEFTPHLGYALASHPTDPREAWRAARAALDGMVLEFDP